MEYHDSTGPEVEEPEIIHGRYVVITPEELQHLADSFGYSEATHNQYVGFQKVGLKFTDAGLTPLVFVDSVTGKMGISTRENFEGKLN